MAIRQIWTEALGFCRRDVDRY